MSVFCVSPTRYSQCAEGTDGWVFNGVPNEHGGTVEYAKSQVAYQVISQP